jgi:hypothetical protein
MSVMLLITLPTSLQVLSILCLLFFLIIICPFPIVFMLYLLPHTLNQDLMLRLLSMSALETSYAG